MLIDEFKITRKLLKGAAILNHGDVRIVFESMLSAKLRITFRLQKTLCVYNSDFDKYYNVLFFGLLF